MTDSLKNSGFNTTLMLFGLPIFELIIAFISSWLVSLVFASILLVLPLFIMFIILRQRKRDADEMHRDLLPWRGSPIIQVMVEGLPHDFMQLVNIALIKGKGMHVKGITSASVKRSLLSYVASRYGFIEFTCCISDKEITLEEVPCKESIIYVKAHSLQKLSDHINVLEQKGAHIEGNLSTLPRIVFPLYIQPMRVLAQASDKKGSVT